MTAEHKISKTTALMVILFSSGILTSMLAYNFATRYYHPKVCLTRPQGYIWIEDTTVKIYPYKDYALPVAVLSAICYAIPLTYTIKQLIKRIKR